MKISILVSAFFICFVQNARANDPLAILMKALEVQQRIERVDHEKMGKLLDEIDKGLGRINDRFKDEEVETVDLEPAECVDVPVEELVCFEDDIILDENICHVDEDHHQVHFR